MYSRLDLNQLFPAFGAVDFPTMPPSGRLLTISWVLMLLCQFTFPQFEFSRESQPRFPVVTRPASLWLIFNLTLLINVWRISIIQIVIYRRSHSLQASYFWPINTIIPRLSGLKVRGNMPTAMKNYIIDWKMYIYQGIKIKKVQNWPVYLGWILSGDPLLSRQLPYQLRHQEVAPSRYPEY